MDKKTSKKPYLLKIFRVGTYPATWRYLSKKDVENALNYSLDKNFPNWKYCNLYYRESGKFIKRFTRKF